MKISFEVDKCFEKDYRKVLKQERKDNGSALTYEDIINTMMTNYHREFVYRVLGRLFCELYCPILRYNKQYKVYEVVAEKIGFEMEIDKYTYDKIKGALLFNGKGGAE